MGTPSFAVASLKKIHEYGYEVSAVVCPPDRPAGRGHKLKACDVKEYALSQNFKILQPEKLKDSNFLQELNELNADLFVVVAFRMLPKEVWSMPKYGTFNIHGSLLPQYRGAAPINWAIINGETKTGVTSFFIDEKIDTGATLLHKECEIGPNDNVGLIHDKLMLLGADLALETCHAIFNESISASPQIDSNTLKEAPKLFKETCKINWSLRAKKIHDHIRGLSPYPVAWTNIKSGDELSVVKIHKANYHIVDHDFKIGDIDLSKKEMKIYTIDGYISILEIQLAGKKKMAIEAYLNGVDRKLSLKAV